MWPELGNVVRLLVSLVFAIISLVAVICCDDDVKIRQLPDCGKQRIVNDKRLVFVSTLDGSVSALNLDDGGSVEWSISTGSGHMVSSSIHDLELTNNGQYVRMIPSLSGGLYTFDGENIRPIPFNADKLLQSSFKFSDDLVISGGKEVRTYGVDPQTGRVLYECSASKCDNFTGPHDAEPVGDIVLVERLTQTVRAVHPRSGSERWNFSVAQHDVKIVSDPSAECHEALAADRSDLSVRVVVPDGLVFAVTKSKPSTVVWQHKFEFPVVSAWQMVRGQLRGVNLLGGAASASLPYSPILYVGMFNKQVYIQESVLLQKKYLEIMAASSSRTLQPGSLPSIPWKPKTASRRLGISGSNEPVLQITDETPHSTTALSVLYASTFADGAGFYLYSAEMRGEKHTCEKINISIINETDMDEEGDGEGAAVVYDEENENYHVEYIIQHINHSVWHWWKEIILITLPTALLINILFFKKFPVWSTVEDALVKVEVEDGVCEPAAAVEEEQPAEQTQCYSSRYLADFEPVSCLGKGGFGVVFQARNKIDDCHYAIKRIPLPNREESRERVMREVKALAKLDHQNIVRFFNAWLECPPTQWQHHQDTLWATKFQRELCSESGAVVDLTGHVTPVSENKSIAVGMSGGGKTILSSLWNRATSFYSSVHRLEQSVQSEPVCATDEDDSFIVFEPPSEKSTATRPQTLSIATDNNHNDNRQTSEHRTQRSAKMFLYIQMQLCKKESLRHWLLNPRRDLTKSLQIFDQIIQAVEYVHMQGLIHRDLKPSNIFFSPEGQIKVGDFGLVTAMVENCGDDVFISVSSNYEGAVVSERHTAMVGTQLYMSPEQLAGENYNYKVDIYSLGLILYELLVPFSTQMERCDSLTKVRSLTFPDRFIQQYPNEHNLLEMMLSKRPEKRPTTIGIRSRPPLRSLQLENTLNDDWHFELPVRQRDPSFSKSSTSNSSLDS